MVAMVTRDKVLGYHTFLHFPIKNTFCYSIYFFTMHVATMKTGMDLGFIQETNSVY